MEKIYYVTSQNIYVQGTTLDKSTSYNYNITNGQVQYCNSTISDGSTTQGYINYVFNSSGKSTEVEKNSTGSIIQSLENDYDSMGRINETKILSPTGSVLAYSVTHYDNWSNVIYTRSYTGQQTWYSFANTNTTNAFEDGASGFDDSFYTNNTISSNIHDLLVGQAYWQNSVGTSNNIETYYNYNSAGELIHEKQLNSSGWQVSSYTYDDYGNQMTSTDPLGRTTYNQYSSTYDHAYLTQSSIEVSGKNISTTFDYTFATGTLSSQTDPNNQTTSYTYDSIGRLTSISYPLVNHVYSYTRYTYNDTGNYLVTTDPNGNNVTDQFDGLGRLVSVITYNGSSIYSTENYTYNYLNSIATKTMPTGSVYSYTYDFLGFQTKTTNPDSSTITYSYNYSNNTETTIDENGHETQYAYDWGHNLLWVKQWNSSSTYYKTSYSYDLTGNLISTTDAKNQETTYTYDNLNRLIQTNYPDGTNQTATYDAVGNVVSTKDPAGNVINYKYDSLNRLLNTTYPDGSSVTYTYDANGNKLSQIYNLSQSYFAYDARNRMINQTDVINGSSFTTLYSYDKANNIASMEYPGGYNLTYTYDPMERVSKVGSFANFTYTLDNNIASISYANGVVTTYIYNSRDEPTNITSMDGSTKVMSLNYTYDSAGNTLKLDNQNYSYNDLNQMTTGNGTWGTIVASYDPAGNILHSNSNGVITNYTYGSYNRLTSIGAVNFTYNANGDTIKLVNGSDTSTYNYDYANRLTSVVANGVTLENNSYDGGTNLVYSVAGIYTTYLVYQGLDIIYSKTHWGLLHNSITEDIYADGLHIAKMVGSTTYFYLLDSQGSTRLVATGSSITFATSYIPFGANYSTYGSELFMYTGKPFDSTIGLYYYNARDYLASVGRFMTEDTQTGKLTDPLSQNRYIYAADNPMKYVDPTGHRFETSSGGGGSSGSSTTTPPPTHGIAPPPPSPVPNPPPAPPLPSSGQSGTSSSASSGTSSGSAITTTTTSPYTTEVTSTSASSSDTTTSTTTTSSTEPLTSIPNYNGIFSGWASTINKWAHSEANWLNDQSPETKIAAGLGLMVLGGVEIGGGIALAPTGAGVMAIFIGAGVGTFGLALFTAGISEIRW